MPYKCEPVAHHGLLVFEVISSVVTDVVVLVFLEPCGEASPEIASASNFVHHRYRDGDLKSEEPPASTLDFGCSRTQLNAAGFHFVLSELRGRLTLWPERKT